MPKISHGGKIFIGLDLLSTAVLSVKLKTLVVLEPTV